MTSKDTYNHVVIGAGISGLARAYRLIQLLPDSGRILVIEPGRIGGVVKTLHTDGFILEQGPNVLLEKPALGELIDALGLREQVIYPLIENYKQLVFFNERSWPVPKSPAAFFSSGLIPFYEKLKLPIKIFKSPLPREAEDQSVCEVFSELIGSTITERILNPAMQGIYGGDINKLSCRSIFPGIWSRISKGESLISAIKSIKKERGISKIFVLEGGLFTLVQTLEAKINGKAEFLKAGVRSLEFNSSAKHFDLLLDNGQQITSFNVHVASSGSATSAYIRNISAVLAESLNSLNYAGLVVLHFAVRRPSSVPHASFGVLVPSYSQKNIIGVMYNSAIFPHVAPSGFDLLTVCAGGKDISNLISMSDTDLNTLIQTELEARFNHRGARLLAVQRWPRAIPQYEIGHYKLVTLLKDTEKQYAGLYFAGTDCNGIGVPDRVQAAMNFSLNR